MGTRQVRIPDADVRRHINHRDRLHNARGNQLLSRLHARLPVRHLRGVINVVHASDYGRHQHMVRTAARIGDVGQQRSFQTRRRSDDTATVLHRPNVGMASRGGRSRNRDASADTACDAVVSTITRIHGAVT